MEKQSKYATHFAIRLFLLGQGNTVLLAYVKCIWLDWWLKNKPSKSLRFLSIQTNTDVQNNTDTGVFMSPSILCRPVVTKVVFVQRA